MRNHSIFADGSACRFRAGNSVIGGISVTKIEATIQSDFGKKPHCIGVSFAALVDRIQFDHLDEVLGDLYLLVGSR
jgi:hypothetical protein